MTHLNIEIKAKCSNPRAVQRKLHILGAVFKGMDHQKDTYFRVNTGRLKVRDGNIEKNLIYYSRPDKSGPKESRITLCPINPKGKITNFLKTALGVLTTVEKKRRIYFIDNVKFHVDTIKDLGHFVEIEAIDYKMNIGKKKLKQQVEKYCRALNITKSDFIEKSYLDMQLNKNLNS